MPITWTDDALDAAIQQLKVLRFSTGMTLREQMALVLNAAWVAQGCDDEFEALGNEIEALRETINSLPE